MNPVVGTAVLLLVVLMSTSASAVNPQTKCRGRYRVQPCRGKAGWFKISGKYCVKPFVNEDMTFDEAERECRRERNGHLASIRSNYQLYKVMCTMYKTTTWRAHYWIGLKRDKNTHHLFRWIDGSGINRMRNFARRQPDDFRAREDCVEMNYWSWGQWNDMKCGARRPYVCGVQL